MTDLPGESGMPGIPLLTGITDKQNQNERRANARGSGYAQVRAPWPSKLAPPCHS